MKTKLTSSPMRSAASTRCAACIDFPDAFVNRMRATKADSKLAKSLEEYGATISFVYFDLDAGLCVERKDGDPYRLSVVLVFNPGDDPDADDEVATAAAEAVEQAVRSRLPADGKSIVLEACFAISEDDITVSKARALTLWRLEHMTLRADDDQRGPFAV